MRPGHVPGLNLVPVKATGCGFLAFVGKNSRVNHSEVKEGLLREIHSIDRVWAVSEGKRPRVWGFQFL